MDSLKLIKNVTIDNALKNFIFRTPIEVQLFEYLITDLNFLKKFKDVQHDIPQATRYYYRHVKTYILSEMSR